MDRTKGADYVTDANGHRMRVGKNVATATNGTKLDPTYDNDMQEEFIAGFLEYAGLTPTTGAQRQVQQALFRLFGGNITTISVNTALTPDQSGIIIVNAAAGNLVITLPAVAAANNAQLRYQFVRSDSSTNNVTISVAGSDKIFPGNLSSVQLTPAAPFDLIGTGANAIWRMSASPVDNSATWHDVTASRTLSVTYTNSHGKPIYVGVSCQAAVNPATLFIYVNGVSIPSSSSAAGGAQIGVLGLVPPGATYEVVENLGGVTISELNWKEYY